MATQDEAPANILPIPPPLEFPFPNVKQTTPPTLEEGLLKANSWPHSDIANESKIGKEQRTAMSRWVGSDANSRPQHKRRTLTERPFHTQKASFVQMRRNQTGLKPATRADDPDFMSFDDDLSSSAEEDLRLISLGSQMNGTHLRKEASLNSNSERNSDERFGRFAIRSKNFQTKGKVSKSDGRLKISLRETQNRGYLAQTLNATLGRHTSGPEKATQETVSATYAPVSKRTKPGLEAKLSSLSSAQLAERQASQPQLNIVVMVIGSRGDIQPFLKIGKILKEDHGHRVRIATHPAFKDFVEQDSHLEFFSVGGDPAELMAFMVKNPGLMPSVSTLKAGEVGRRRNSMFEMFQGFWRACINTSDDEHDEHNRQLISDNHPFVADAIIANPPCFAHIHCAERLGVPLHLMFTFPYSPTQQFPHPLANIKRSNVDTGHLNFMSYPLVEMM